MAQFGAQYFPDIMNSIVTAIQTDSLPRFDYGYWKEQANTISIKGYDWENDDSFPLVFLPVNYVETFPSDTSYYADINFTLYILTKSQKDYKSSERFEDVLKATLYPIYENLINEIMGSNYFERQGKRFLEYEKQDLYYFDGEVNENKLNTPVEAIRLSFTDLKLSFISECNNY